MPGYPNFMIQSGGDSLRRRAGVAIDRGGSASGPARISRHDVCGSLELTDVALSTFRRLRAFFIAIGRRYHHILDPDTGEPALRSRSVSIVAKTSTAADGLSTGVFTVLGGEEGMALIEKTAGRRGRDRHGREQSPGSSGLRERLALLEGPDGVAARRARCQPFLIRIR
jgi:thiamine biosynthesis lipoprotein